MLPLISEAIQDVLRNYDVDVANIMGLQIATRAQENSPDKTRHTSCVVKAKKDEPILDQKMDLHTAGRIVGYQRSW
jgi:hypothetical protein